MGQGEQGLTCHGSRRHRVPVFRRLALSSLAKNRKVLVDKSIEDG
ncbi:hypothetical protein ACVILE_000088 [Streptomyces sp. M18.1]